MTDEKCLIDEHTWVLVLTGAGVSAESGIQTFRGAGGFWEKYRLEDLASPAAFERDPGLVWKFYGGRRAAAHEVSPNPGHVALAELEQRLGDRFLLATQNVDGLHRRAGSKRVFELHGRLFATRCSRCDRPAFDDDKTYTHSGDALPTCDLCEKNGRKAYLRPHIVWFGEALDGDHLDEVQQFLMRGRQVAPRLFGCGHVGRGVSRGWLRRSGFEVRSGDLAGEHGAGGQRESVSTLCAGAERRDSAKALQLAQSSSFEIRGRK